ncbi:MAG: Jag N-terminal domain-containing protein [Chloroflexota bacterium]|jgi:spoIIIJ-associated protein|nr:Jag N-terminal domain-containing protein [Chloroflexota bacterium]
MTFREFTGKNVEEAIRTAMAEFSSDLSELDIEILAQGSRGVLGVGAEEARILAAPKSAIAAADSVRVESVAVADESPPTVPEPQAEPEPVASAAREPQAPVDSPPPADEPAPVDLEVAAVDAEEQVAELERADAARRTRGSRGRGGRGRNGRERDREQPVREGRPDAAPREPRADRPGREPAPFVSAKPIEELTEEERSTLETAKTVLTEMLGLMELKATVEIASDGDTARLNVRGDDLAALIGRRGEKLASLQHIVNLIVGRREGQHHRIAIDVENYRGRREQQLRDVADRAAKRVIQSGKIIQLEAMPAIERRVVHMALLENPRIRTQSVGVEPNRRIVVLPASQVKE